MPVAPALMLDGVLAIPWRSRQSAMVGVDVLYRWSPPQLRRVLDRWCAYQRPLALIAIIVWWGWDYARRGGDAEHGGTGVGVHVLGYLAMPVGGAVQRAGHRGQPDRPAAP